MVTIIKGNIISATELGKLDLYPNSFLVAVDNKIEGIFDILPEQFKKEKIDDYGDNIIIQAFSDMHIHAPQYAMMGMGMDLPLLDWLNTYTFPTEAHFKNPEVAKKVYSVLAKELIKNGTTRVAMFSSLHVDSTLILMEELEKAGVSGFVGKVNMDRNGSPELQETTQESINETMRWLDESKKFKYIKPIITPRFTPSCTNELMETLGNIAKKYNLPIQSHLSENIGEINWVKELHPDCEFYYQTYEKYNMWNNKTLMAHCVHSSKQELDAIKKAGVFVVHCASSNENLSSGYASIKKMLNQGIDVVLGSDVAGGDHLSMFDNVTATIRASKARQMMDDYKTPFLTVEEAFYLATSAANKFFNEAPGFAKGNSLHALVIDDSSLASIKELTLTERFERLMYRKENTAIKAVYSNSTKVL